MPKRFVSIWFRYLRTDWLSLRQPGLSKIPFVLATPDHGRMIITAANELALGQDIQMGMTVADARVIIPSLQFFDDDKHLPDKLLRRLAEWCIRFTPFVAVDPPDGLILDVTGCSHLWGGDKIYLNEIIQRLKARGYNVQAAMADSIGASWAIARFGKEDPVIQPGEHSSALLSLPAAALRLDFDTTERLYKLGLRQIKDFARMPRSALRRRFGQQLTDRIDEAFGHKEETIRPVVPIEPYQERLPCLEPIITATGVEIAVQRLLDTLCRRIQQEGKGIRSARLKCYRADSRIEQIEIGTIHPSHSVSHLFKLFEIKLPGIEPGPGIDLFVLEAPKVEDDLPMQERLWSNHRDLDNTVLFELLDRLSGKFGRHHIHRYLPDEHFWPERSVRHASSLTEKLTAEWIVDRPRPIQLLSKPERIIVTAPIPDYPPMNFRYKGQLHTIRKADGPERIEQEWWLQEGEHRDYYYVEDEEGCRYWLFRSGPYSADRTYQWFIHGFFA